MRLLPIVLLSFILTACSQLLSPGTPSGPVDATHLPPLSGQEQALLISADASAASGDNDSAERNYLTAVGKSQGHVEAHLSLANLYLRENQPGKAREVLAKAIELQPHHPEANHLLGKIAMEEGQPRDALADFNRGLEGDPANLDLLNGAGVAHDVLHQHHAAQVLYLRALGLHPDVDQAMTKTNLALSYLLDNQPKAAIDLLKNEVKKPGAPAQMRDNLALAYGLAGKHVEARKLAGSTMTEDERQASLGRLRAYIAAEGEGPVQKAGAPNPQPPAEPSIFAIGK